MSKNKIKLNICGSEFVISSEDTESYIRSVGDEVEQAIEDITSRNEHISVSMAAMLAALNYCDEAHKAARAADNLRSQIKDYLEDSNRARTEAEESKKEIDRLKKELQALRAKLTEGSSDGKDEEKPVSPAQKPNAAPPVQRAQTGSYTRVQHEVTPEQEGFISFFEKNTDEE
ncbi:MAG: cell division protein ZapA [Ruminococcaceae bacterium]|nr:cell division protein ZapA [Oscillospiraceae bacterium]